MRQHSSVGGVLVHSHIPGRHAEQAGQKVTGQVRGQVHDEWEKPTTDLVLLPCLGVLHARFRSNFPVPGINLVPQVSLFFCLCILLGCPQFRWLHQNIWQNVEGVGLMVSFIKLPMLLRLVRPFRGSSSFVCYRIVLCACGSRDPTRVKWFSPIVSDQLFQELGAEMVK